MGQPGTRFRLFLRLPQAHQIEHSQAHCDTVSAPSSQRIGYIDRSVQRPSESYLARAVRFAKSILTGGAASLADFATLTALVELFHLAPTRANVPSLLVGATIQFIGNRHLVFSAGHLAIGPQLLGFVLVEIGTFLLNAASFYAVVKWTPVPYPIARLVCSFLIFTLFSYPLWKRVFSHKQRETTKPG